MSKANNKDYIKSYKFHHIDKNKCHYCRDFWCEKVCFRGIYKVIDKKIQPECIVIEDREDSCIKCHICTTACKSKAITID
ncbi:MAG: hypothetical protein ACTSPD_06005 [Promethearchaeota archaeon]